MSKVNRGKDFENAIYNAFVKIPNFTFDRLPDPMAGFAGIRNICDYFGYKYPNAFYIECKSCYGNTFPFHNITANQWTGLLDKDNVPGVVAGYMIWFIDHDRTVFISANTMREWKLQDKKSINIKDLNNIEHIDIDGTKKRVMFNYDLTSFIDEVAKWV